MPALEVAKASTVHFVVDGKDFETQAVPGSLLEVLRRKGVKTVKHACGEGGCGACAVLVSEVDQDGRATTRSVNSCLMPMYAADGCNITTADGLPRNAEGVNPVAERMAGFFASQCGFCTAGMAVACHATLTKAASQGRQATAADLRDGLDGNLCRCTGYRPIVDACKSFACDVDMEDLGYNVFTTEGRNLPAAADVTAAAPATVPSSAGLKVLQLAETQQSVYVPTNIEQLKQVMSQHESVRMVAGNTGTGVYKDWPLNEPVLAYINQVKELQGIDVITQDSTTFVRVGAATTLAQFIDQLTGWVTAATASKQHETTKPAHGVLGAAAVWAEMASHLKRVAGNHVRGAGTMVGNLVLTKEKGLPSDVATLLLATGALVQLVDLKQPDAGEAAQMMPLGQFLASKELPPSHLLTNIHLPVPGVGTRFWSSRIAARYTNAASVINAAAMLPAAGTGQAHFVLGMNVGHTHGPEQWHVHSCGEVEAVLSSAAAGRASDLSSAVAAAALAALSQDLSTLFGLPTLTSGTAEQDGGANKEQQEHLCYLRATAEGLLLQALTAVMSPGSEHLFTPELHCVLEGNLALSHHGGRSSSPDSTSHEMDVVTDGNGGHHHHVNGHAANSVRNSSNGAACSKPALFDAVKLPSPAVVQGKQELLTPDASMAPLTYSYPKETAKLQARGAAHYSDDVPICEGALYGAYVLSSIAKGTVLDVDTTAALAAPGAVNFIGVKDVPAPPVTGCEPVFAHDIEYYGQPIGLMLATSYQAAMHAAKLVRVDYNQQKPVLDPYEAVGKGSVYPLPALMYGLEAGALNGSVRVGSTDAAAQVDAAPNKLKGIRWHLPSQYHMYMEPQTAVAEVDEDGCLLIHCATQNYDNTQLTVAGQLGLPHNKVEIRCRRIGGGFGGKFDHVGNVATAAAVAAVKTGKQVRLAVQRNQDMLKFGGRCEVDAEYDVGFDNDGKITALDVKSVLSGGAFLGFTTFEVDGWATVASSVYDVPHMQLQFNLAKLNLPTRTSVRGPGSLTGNLFMEVVMDNIAAALGMDPCVVRERNMRQLPPPGVPFKSSLGKSMGNPELFTLPRIWQELKNKSSYEARRQAVEQFNASHMWRKRGLSIVPCIYGLPAFRKGATVHIYLDGSVRVAHGGVDMGQGMGIKVMQTASYELSKLLPPSQRPIPLELFRPADPSTYTLPHSGITGGSAGTEGACASIRVACAELVRRIQPLTADMGDNYTWQDVMNKLVFIPGGFAAKVDLTASASAIPGDEDVPLAMLSYVTYGAAVTEVEIDVLTGDRRLKSVDILMDCGKSINPGVDMGQIEGAYVFGAGFMLGEAVVADQDTGAVMTNSTWHYKVASVHCVPEKFNIALLKDSPGPYEGPLGAKAVGEPPLMLSSGVVSAITAASRAAARQVYGITPPASENLQLPALPQHIKHMCGMQPLQEVLQALKA